MENKKITLLGHRDAYEFLDVSKTTFDKLVKTYNIPFHKTSSGRIFEKSVLIDFQNSKERKKNLKHKKK